MFQCLYLVRGFSISESVCGHPTSVCNSQNYQLIVYLIVHIEVTRVSVSICISFVVAPLTLHNIAMTAVNVTMSSINAPPSLPNNPQHVRGQDTSPGCVFELAGSRFMR
jgi:hypothetical protein